MNTMRLFRSKRNALFLGLLAAVAVGGAHAASVPLKLQDEEAVPFSAMQVTNTPGGPSGSKTTMLRTDQPVLCGSVAAADTTNYPHSIILRFAGALASGDFQFGGIDVGTGLQYPVSGIGFWNFSAAGLAISVDPNTICYSLDADGLHSASVGLFSDNFEVNTTVDASITTSVAGLPTFASSYTYTYYVDVRIPAQFVGQKFLVRDGFDASLFDTSHSRYCEVDPPATSCASVTYNSVDKVLDVPPGGVIKRYIVQRPLRPNVQMPADTSRPVTFAALFVKDGIDRNLANNVSPGRGVLSDQQPVIIADTSMVSGMVEGNGLSNVNFTIADDTAESGSALLNASVSLSFNGNLMPASALSCSLASPQLGETVRRNCRFDIPVFDPNFATDITPGNYAPGVSATILITATDALNQSSTRSIPFHIASGDNDPPSFSLSPIAVPDAGNGGMLTVTCDLNAPPPYSEQCLGSIENFVLDRKPGAPGSADESAYQGAFFAGVGSDNRLVCTGDMNIFTNPFPQGRQSPRFIIDGTRIGLDYQLSGAPGVADCQIVVGDSNLPAGQSYNQTLTLVRFKAIE